MKVAFACRVVFLRYNTFSQRPLSQIKALRTYCDFAFPLPLCVKLLAYQITHRQLIPFQSKSGYNTNAFAGNMG
jgi:hypothetical protein